MLNAGIMIIDKHGRDNVSLLFPIFENYLNKKVSLFLLWILLQDTDLIFFFVWIIGIDNGIHICKLWNLLYLI